MKLKRIIFNNFGLKVTALFIAVFVWIQITGNQRLYIERTLDVDVEYVNVSQNINVSFLRPEKVKVKVRGTSSKIQELSPEDFKMRLDLSGVKESMPLSFFTEDYLITPPEIQVVSVHPKMIEMQVEEFMSKVVPVKPQFENDFPRGVRLKEIVLKPHEIKIFGYKSLIRSINSVSLLEVIDRSKIKDTTTFRIPLKKREEILKFEDIESVDITVVVEKYEKRNP
jgi:YbbR domain-containing protein